MLGGGKDSALVRYGLGVEYLKRGDLGSAIAHLGVAVELDSGHSAAWKHYGKGHF